MNRVWRFLSPRNQTSKEVREMTVENTTAPQPAPKKAATKRRPAAKRTPAKKAAPKKKVAKRQTAKDKGVAARRASRVPASDVARSTAGAPQAAKASGGTSKVDKLRGLFTNKRAAHTMDEIIKHTGFDPRSAASMISVLKRHSDPLVLARGDDGKYRVGS